MIPTYRTRVTDTARDVVHYEPSASGTPKPYHARGSYDEALHDARGHDHVKVQFQRLASPGGSWADSDVTAIDVDIRALVKSRGLTQYAAEMAARKIVSQ